MKTIIRSFVASLLITAIALAGGFNVKATGNQTFSWDGTRQLSSAQLRLKIFPV